MTKGAADTLHDEQVEAGLLGVCLRAPETLPDIIAAGINGSSFYAPAHQLVWDAIDDLGQQGLAVDATTVHGWLQQRGLLERVGGETGIVALVDKGYERSVGNYATQLVRYERLRWSWHKLHEASNGSFAERRQIIADVIAQEDAWDATGGDSYFVDSHAVLAGERGPAPTVLERSCGTAAMFYRGKVNSVVGASESGKSWLAQAACVEQIRLCEHVFYEDFEKDAAEVYDRLLGMGATEGELVEFFHYKRREDQYTTASLAALSALATDLKPAVFVFDGVNAALDMHGLKSNLSEDIVRLYEGAPRRLAKSNAAVILVDHDKKDPDSTTPGAGGSQHKRSGITGASYKMYLSKKFSRTQSGRGYLKVDKDALGWARAACADSTSFGDVDFEVADGTLRAVRVSEPRRAPVTKSAEGVTRRTGYMEKCSLIAARHGLAGVSVDAARKELECRREYVLDAFVCLAAEGFVMEEGEGTRRRYTHVQPFMESSSPLTRSFYEAGDGEF